MARLLRFDRSHAEPPRRWVVGLLTSPRCERMAAAVISASDRGLQIRAEVAGVLQAELPREATRLFDALASKKGASAGSLAGLRASLVDLQAPLVLDLLAESGVAPGRVLAVGVHDPGLWKSEDNDPTGYLGLCDPARLAEATGLNIIDAFPARDVACGGLGGPVTALAQWMLLKNSQTARVLLDLGRTIRLTYLPAESTRNATGRILAFEVGPGTILLDRLAEQLTAGEQRFDPGGRLAVQGRQIPELLDHWLADPCFVHPLPRWHPRGVRPERFLTDSVQMAVDNGWAVRDLLCSATHFLAETVARTFLRRLPQDAHVEEIVVTGGGQHNGLLLREIGRRTERPIVHLAELGLSDMALGPAAIAMLTLFHLDEVPANQTSVTGTEVPRVLGRITPGSPQSWQRLLHSLTGNQPEARALRSAM